MQRFLPLLVMSVCLASAHIACAQQSRPAESIDSVEFLNSGKVLPTNLPFSEAVRVGNVVYLSGQIGIVPGSMKLTPGGIKEETRQAMENIKTTLDAHGYKLGDIVKCTVM